MKVVFFDRDGVLINEPANYRVLSEDQAKLFDDTVSALKILADNDYKIIILTNQAGIEEGLLTEADFWRIHNSFLGKLVPSGIEILRTYKNDETNRPDASLWRKPGPNMLLDAGKDFDLDLSQIYMIGDNQSDIEAALRAGCKGGVLVKTATNKDVVSENAAFTAQNLTEAVNWIIKN